MLLRFFSKQATRSHSSRARLKDVSLRRNSRVEKIRGLAFCIAVGAKASSLHRHAD